MIGEGKIQKKGEISGGDLKKELLKILSNSLQNKQNKKPNKNKTFIE